MLKENGEVLPFLKLQCKNYCFFTQDISVLTLQVIIYRDEFAHSIKCTDLGISG